MTINIVNIYICWDYAVIVTTRNDDDVMTLRGDALRSNGSYLRD